MTRTSASAVERRASLAIGRLLGGRTGRPRRRSSRSATRTTSTPREVAADDEGHPGRIRSPCAWRSRQRIGGPVRLDRLARRPTAAVIRRRRRRRSCRRRPPRRAGAGRPAPGGGRSGRSSRRRSTSAPGMSARATTSATSSSAAPSRSAGTSTPTDMRVPAGLGVERRAEALGGLDVARSRRAAPCPRSARRPASDGRAGLLGRLVGRAARRGSSDADTSAPTRQVDRR